MRSWATLLVVLLSVTAVWAQTTVVVPVVSPTTPATMACPAVAVSLPQPCPVLISQDVTGEPILLVLGTEESFALDNTDVRNLNWTRVSSAYTGVFEQGNPLTHIRVNGVVTRHGNPYYPYVMVGTATEVAGLEEVFIPGMAGLSATDRNTLAMVAARYRGLTTAQAMTLGYQPVGTFTPGQGQVYVNQALLAAPFNAAMPQAFVFDRNGRLAGVQYHVMSATPVTIFGQPTVASTIVPGAQQLTVWLFTDNPNGRFATANPRIR
ncbi:MAG: hypothetical protein ACYDCO_02055 [Armatimonadota bacterium]